jgi:hypothetical protein
MTWSHRARIVLTCFVLTVVPAPAASDTGPSAPDPAGETPEPPATKPFDATSATAGNGGQATAQSIVVPAPAELEKQLEAAQLAELKYDVYRFRHAERVYDAQHTYTQVIFIVVLAIVGMGMWFSWLQFRDDRRYQVRGPKATKATTATVAITSAGEAEKAKEKEIERQNENPPPVVAAVSQVSIGPQGVTVSSPVLGVIILGLSLGFFYLYLHYVYPIQNAHCSSSQSAPAKAPDTKPEG